MKEPWVERHIPERLLLPAAMTSQTSMATRENVILSSFTSSMLAERGSPGHGTRP
jgi:hypothetical protein